ncbi:PREDICTED: inactive serine protease 54 [Hipposideros armiger]|uniref:Inactive serine protease 54 n=1 Tax=Hipposideros armiger TaxID=186990 RepID=A0A8B7T2V3_HIPAR|nr:PREDICTED: inactive serine protease 54 [Hipposideros armiger]
MRGMLLVLLYVSHASASCGIQKTNVIEPSEEGLVSEKEFPWVVSLQDSRYAHLAFGSILSEFWILSVASVFHNRKDAVVVVGIANMDARVIAHEEYPVNTIIIHEDFDNETMAHNIALLKTDTAMQFNSLVRPICFLGRELQMLPALWNCWVAGWNPTTAVNAFLLLEEAGDPGNPMMCQLQQLNLWVLKGILSQGGEKCPGLFLYIKVEDYSDWITSKTQRTSLPLSSFHHRANSVPSSSYSSYVAVTKKKYSRLGQAVWSPPHFQGQRRATIHSRATSSSRESLDFRVKSLRKSGRSPEVAVQPMYYDYYGEDTESISGRNRLHQPQEMVLFCSVLVSFAMVCSLGDNPPN